MEILLKVSVFLCFFLSFFPSRLLPFPPLFLLEYCSVKAIFYLLPSPKSNSGTTSVGNLSTEGRLSVHFTFDLYMTSVWN